ncbi:MAG TPA: hypothetical protein VMP11_17795 [Verrucomicrobiae bacterium]|nr:hypothetical protein [Verrucomicrobiae bacterium]
MLLAFISAPVVSAGGETAASALIPFEAITGTNLPLVRGVTDHYTLRREYPSETFSARLDVFEYLFDHMDACSVLAQMTGLTKYRASLHVDGRLKADDHEGASGYILRVYAGGGKRVLYVEGTERGVFNVQGRGVAVVDYREGAGGNIEYTRGIFVKVDNAMLAALAQLFSVFLRGTVDGHFAHVIRNPVILSEQAQQNPDRLLRQIKQFSAADQQLLAPFAALLRSDYSARLAPDNHSP